MIPSCKRRKGLNGENLASLGNYIHSDFNHIDTPTAPSTGVLKIYSKSDDNLYIQNSAGVESAINTGAASNPFDQDLNTTDDVIFNSVDVKQGLVMDDTTTPILPVGAQHTLYVNGDTLYMRDNLGDDRKINNYQNSSTGVLTGGVLSIGTPNTTFSITDGTGSIVVDDPLGTGAISSVNVEWTGKTNITVTALGGSQLITFISIDSGGNVLQSATKPTPAERRDNIFIGVVIHVDTLTVDEVNNEQDYSVEPLSQLRDLFDAIGFINIWGNVLSDTGSGLTIAKGAGKIFASGSNYSDEPHAPNTRPLSVKNTSTGDDFQYRMSDGTNTTPNNTDIDPNNYESPLGTLTSVSNQKYTTQRFYIFTSNNIKVQYGQTQYNSLAEAEADLAGSFTTESSIAANGLLIGYLIVKKGVTNLTTAIAGGDAEFFVASKFGVVQGSTTASTLQNVYDNSIAPHILTSSSNPLTIEAGVLNDPIIEGQNLGGNTLFQVTGDGTCSAVEFKESTNSGLLMRTSLGGSDNFTCGTNSGGSLTTGAYNVAIGHNSLPSVTSTDNNVCLGYNAGQDLDTTSSNNVLIGTRAGAASLSVQIGRTAIGHNIQNPYDNSVCLGNTNNTKVFTLGGNCDLGDSTYKFNDLYLKNEGRANIGTGEIYTDASNILQISNGSVTNRDIRFNTDAISIKIADTDAALRPDVGTISLGTVAKPWSDLYLSGSVKGAAIEPRVLSTASSATPTVNADDYDQFNITALVVNATWAAPTGTPLDGQKLIMRIKSGGSARTLAFNAIFRAIGVTLPTTTNGAKTIYMGCIYNSASSTWDVVAVTEEA